MSRRTMKGEVVELFEIGTGDHQNENWRKILYKVSNVRC